MVIAPGGDNFPIFNGRIWVVGPAAAAAQQEAERAGVTLPLRWREIHGRSMAIDQIRLRVSDLSCDAVMGAVSVLSRLVDWDRLPDGEPAQFRAARLMLSPDLARRVIFHLGEGHRGLVVSHEQLLVAARMAVALGRPRPADWVAEWPRIGEVLLGINDLIGDARGDVEVPQGDDILGMIVRGNVLRPEEPPVNRLARYRWLLSRDPEHVTDAPQLVRDNPPADLFQTMYGLSVEEFAVCHLIYRQDFDELSRATSPGSELFAFGRRGFRANIADDLHERFLHLSAATRDELAARFDTPMERPELTSLSFEPFLDRPVYRLSTGGAIPISHYLLHEQMGPGFYWLLRQAYAGGWRKGNVGRSAFGDYMGKIFQLYIDELLQRAYSVRNAGTFLTERQVGSYDRQGTRVDPSDGFVIEDGRIGVIECWSAPLSPATLIGSGSAFRQEVQVDLMDKLQQLDRVIGDLESGTLTLPGGKPDGFRGYVPILVMLHPFPQHPVILTAVLDEVDRRGLFKASTGGPGILPAQLVSADDLELLEPVLAAGGDGLTHHLVRRHASAATRGYSVRRYLVQHRRSIPDNTVQRSLVKELTDLAGQHIEDEVRRRNQV